MKGGKSLSELFPLLGRTRMEEGTLVFVPGMTPLLRQSRYEDACETGTLFA